MSRRIRTLALFGALSAALTVRAEAKCPSTVYEVVRKTYPSSKVSQCKEETEEGKLQYEVKLTTRESRALELDVSPEGVVLQTEEVVAVAAVPSAVIFTFKAKYPDATVARAEKQTKNNGSVTYEFAFQKKGMKHEATFKQDGTFSTEE